MKIPFVGEKMSCEKSAGLMRTQLHLSRMALLGSYRSQLYLLILTFSIVLSGMDVTVAAERFNYADNIGFIKDAAKLRDEFPICDEFLDVEWFHQIHRRSSDTWIGKSRLDIYDGDRKDSKAIMATMRCKGEKCTEATVHLIELEQYFDKKLEEWIRKTDRIRRNYCFDYPGGCDDVRPVSLGILINTNSNDRDLFLSVIAGKTNLWDSYLERRIRPWRGDSGRADLWISTTLIGAVPWRSGNRWVRISHGLYPNGYPRLSIGHFRRNICILSPAGNEVGIVEPSLPLFPQLLLLHAEPKKKFDAVKVALSELFPRAMLQGFDFKNHPDWMDILTRTGSQMESILVDVDGENGPDLVLGGSNCCYFTNDPDPFIRLSGESVPPNKNPLRTIMVSSEEIKTLQKTVLKEKKKFRLQLKAKKQKDTK